MLKRCVALVVVAVALFGCSGMFEPDYVEAVKGGVMAGYSATTVGQAFDASFDNPQWSTYETEKGARYVEFKGAISQKTHDAIAQVYEAEGFDGDVFWPTGTEVLAQWVISADGESFQLQTLSSECWDGQFTADYILSVIYS